MATVIHDAAHMNDKTKCIHIGTAPVTYHRTGPQRIAIILKHRGATGLSCTTYWVDATCPCPCLCVCLCACEKTKRKNKTKQKQNKAKVYRLSRHKNTRRKWHSKWRQSAHTKGKSKAEIAPALHITCDQAYPVNNTQQLVNIMAHMVYSTLLTSTVRS